MLDKKIIRALGIWGMLLPCFGMTGCHFKTTTQSSDGLPTETLSQDGRTADGPSDASSARRPDLMLLQYALLLVDASYVEPQRIDWQKMAVYAIDAIQKQIPEVVARFDRRIDDAPNALDLRVNLAQKHYDISGMRTLAEVHKLCADVFQFVFRNLNDPQNAKEIEYAMINGMFTTLDPHTNLLPPYMLEDLMTGNGGFAGCGFVVGVRDNQLTVISPIEGAPAWRVGIKAGDAVVRIDDESTENMPLQDAVDRMRGEPGSTVTLYIIRRGWTEPRPFVITRENIVVKSVTSKALTQDNVGYLKLKSFDKTTAEEARRHLEELHKAMPDMKGLILDLRNNSGGLLVQSVEIAEMFLEADNTIVTTDGGRKALRDTARARKTGSERGYPLVVLINEGTASASEIVSGALQFHNRAVIVGERSFGKGSVQILKEIQEPSGETSAIKVTASQYLTPGEISIQGVGIIPDIRLTPSYVDKESTTSLGTNHRVRREDSLEQSLHSEKTVDRQSFIELSYLYKAPKEEEERAKALGLTTYDLRSTEDYVEDDETRFAAELIKQATSDNRETILSTSTAFFNRYRSNYDDTVKQALTAFDVDWTVHPAANADPVTAPQPNDFSWGFEIDGKPVLPDAQGRLALDLAKHGEKQKITMWAKNNARHTYEGVIGMLVTNNPYLDEREFVFGTMKPNETRRWDIQIKVPMRAESRDDRVEIDFTAKRMLDAGSNQWLSLKSPCAPAHNATGKDKCQWPRPTFDARVLPAPAPVLSWSAWLDDTGRGNADAALSRGESVDMYVWVKNTSDVDTDKVTVALANESGSGILLKNGRVTLDPIPAGGSRLAHLSFDISQDKPQKPPTKRIKRSKPFDPSSASLILMISDTTHAIDLSQPLTFPVSDTRPIPSGDALKPARLAAGAEITSDREGQNRLAKPSAEQYVMARPLDDKTAVVCWPEDGLLPCAFASASSIDDTTPDRAAVAELEQKAADAAERIAKPTMPSFGAGLYKSEEEKNKKIEKLPPKPDSVFAPVFSTKAPVVTFDTRPHTENAAEVTLYATISDDEMLKSYEAYVWTLNGIQLQVEKLDYALVTTASKRLAIDVPLKQGDNSLVIIARDQKDIEGVGIFHIQRE